MQPDFLCEPCARKLAATPLGDVLRALIEAPPGSLAVLWVHPERWDPGEQSFSRQRVQAFLRTQGWELMRQLACDVASLGSLHIFQPRAEQTRPRGISDR